MALAVLLLLGFFWSLVHTQRVPYVSFMDQTLANHSYVDLSQVGRSDITGGGDDVQCITDLSTCCTRDQGAHRGDWFFPNGTRLPFPAPNVGTFEDRENRRVDLRRNTNANSPVGIYRCDIPTNAVHDDDTSVRDTVYVGLYTASGGNAIRKSHNNQDCHWLTIIYGPQIYYFSCLYSSPIMYLHSVPPFYLSL